jgi:hypothetical protein
MNKTTIHVAPADKSLFESTCGKHKTAWNLILETEKNVLYEIEWSSPNDLYWLGVWYGYAIGRSLVNQAFNEAHTH